MKGIDLKVQRTAARIRLSDLARAMTVSPSRVSHIESRDDVTEDATRKYLAALQTLTTVSAPREAA